jgi:hypothetical protein
VVLDCRAFQARFAWCTRLSKSEGVGTTSWVMGQFGRVKGDGRRCDEGGSGGQEEEVVGKS